MSRVESFMLSRPGLNAPVSYQSQSYAISRENETSGTKLAATALVIAVLALTLLSFRINRPPNEVWDEILYIRIARSLVQGHLSPLPEQASLESFGRQHPPLAPYLIAAGMKLVGDNPLGWRFAGVVCGALTVVGLFLWTYVLLRDYQLAVMAAVLALLNNFLYVLARTAMPDVYLFTFAIWAILAFSLALEAEISTRLRRVLTVSSGALFGLAIACKWNAVDSWFATVFIVAGLLFCRKHVDPKNDRLLNTVRSLRSIGTPSLVLGLFVAPVVAYVATFLPLFHAMDTPLSLSALARMHGLMLELTKAATGNPSQLAPWYTWPFRTSPTRALSYLLGNPVVMWGGFISLLVCAMRLLKRMRLPEAFVICFYLANLLQWAITPIKIPNYYYYFPAAMFLGPAIAVALGNAARKKVLGVELNLLIMLAAAIVFLYCYQRMAYLEPPWDCMLGCWS